MPLEKKDYDDSDKGAAPGGDGRFAEYAMTALHGLRIFLGGTYEKSINRLK